MLVSLELVLVSLELVPVLSPEPVVLLVSPLPWVVPVSEVQTVHTPLR